jgi:uncharacterized membrane protein SpoIIM required for sporulation
VIIDLDRFVAAGRPCWTELEQLLDRLEADAALALGLDQARRLHFLYERTAADLDRLATFASEPELRRYLEGLVARAYSEIHESRERPHRVAPLRWFVSTFPRTFRRHARAFGLAVALTALGALLGGLATALDPAAKAVLMPFPHLLGDPAERVAREEQAGADGLQGRQGTFSAVLMTHNTKVALFTLALGMSWGVGTVIILFYNGVILGAVGADYLLAGQGRFLVGWLLPHGAVEIPAILIAGQAGLVLAGALIGWGRGIPLRARFRAVGPDLCTLALGVSVLLVWAGLVEAFLSQYHEPVLPYAVKIAFGSVELLLLALFLARAGRPGPPAPAPDP